MEPVRNDIDAPLGQDQRRSEQTWRPSAAAILLIFCAAVIFTASTAIALRERPFRSLPPVAVSVPVVTEAPMQQASETPPKAKAAVPGPAIIRVDPGGKQASEGTITIRDPSTLGRSNLVAHLPDRALIEQSEVGPLPVRDASGRRPFDVYARPWSGARGARIAVVIGGLGISQTGTQQAIQMLPPEITLAFAPLGNSLTRWMQTARREGHEIILQVPLEPFDYPRKNPGHRTLLADAPPAENLQNLLWVLARTTNYTGVMNYMGARFTADSAAMDLLMGELGRRGLLFLDEGSSARSLAQETALAKGVPFAAGDVVIDQQRERGAILGKLDELERIARARGFAVGTGSALEITVETVAAWAAEVRKRGIELVPISAVVIDPERS